jgi:hypothetical protein
LVVVGWPQAELARWEDSDGVVARRFVDLCRRYGWILRPEELMPDEIAALDAVAAQTGEDLVWRGSASASSGFLPLGTGDGLVPLRWEGDLPPGEPGRVESESRAWLASARRIRWEEVVEMLDLTGAENRAFQQQRDGAGLFSPIRAAYLRDKSGANLAIYLVGTRRPHALLWRLELNRAFEETVVPLAHGLLVETAADPTRSPMVASGALANGDPSALDAAHRRLFARRLLASRSRVYGRSDRILLSLAAEAPRGTTLIVDARASNDPFIAAFRVGERLGPAATRGDGLLRELGQRDPS